MIPTRLPFVAWGQVRFWQRIQRVTGSMVAADLEAEADEERQEM